MRDGKGLNKSETFNLIHNTVQDKHQYHSETSDLNKMDSIGRIESQMS